MNISTESLSVDNTTRTPIKPRYWHYWISLLLALALAPVLRFEHLPLKFDWITLGIAYWILLAAQSIFAAVLLCLIGLPWERVLKPLLARYRKDPLCIVPLLLFVATLVWLTGWLRALLLALPAFSEIHSAD